MSKATYSHHSHSVTIINRLNSGIRNCHIFLDGRFFLFQKIGSDSVNHGDSGDIKVLVQFPGISILKFPGIQPIYYYY